MACLPKGQYGTNNAATVASHLTRGFLNIQHRLLVGIGGGAPGSADIRLGDVVVSTEVLQYDLGKTLPHDIFQRTAYPIRPPQSLTVVSKLQASQNLGTSPFSMITSEASVRLPHYSHPKLPDRLFRSDYSHRELQEAAMVATKRSSLLAMYGIALAQSFTLGGSRLATKSSRMQVHVTFSRRSWAASALRWKQLG